MYISLMHIAQLYLKTFFIATALSFELQATRPTKDNISIEMGVAELYLGTLLCTR